MIWTRHSTRTTRATKALPRSQATTRPMARTQLGRSQVTWPCLTITTPPCPTAPDTGPTNSTDGCRTETSSFYATWAIYTCDESPCIIALRTSWPHFCPAALNFWRAMTWTITRRPTRRRHGNISPPRLPVQIPSLRHPKSQGPCCEGTHTKCQVSANIKGCTVPRSPAGKNHPHAFAVGALGLSPAEANDPRSVRRFCLAALALAAAYGTRGPGPRPQIAALARISPSHSSCRPS